MQELLNNINNWFSGNPILNFVFLILAILGIIFSFYFYFKSKKTKIPIYIVRTINLIRESIKKIETVEILYSGKKIENLSITKIAIWNDGRDTIEYTDIAHINPLRITVKNKFDILDAEIIFQKNVANDFKIKIEEDKKSVLIQFDFFDFEEGIVVQIAYTGNFSSDVKLEGSIKSVKEVIRKGLLTFRLPFLNLLFQPNKGSNFKSRTNLKIMGWASIFTGAILIFLPYFLDFNTINNIDKKIDSTLFIAKIFVLVGILYMYIGIRFLNRRIPKGFDIFDEEI
ncbi:MAG: hypothetical protein ABI199_05125 [Bacteroidia bacterium]